MNEYIRKLTQTGELKHMLAPRLIGGLPLLGIGMMHLTGAAPMRPILEAANIPMVGLHAALVPLVEIVAGAMLLAGAFARVGGVLAVLTMIGAIYAHAVATWEDEPPIVLPIVVLVAAGYVVVRGAGAWSVDRKLQASTNSKPTKAD